MAEQAAVFNYPEWSDYRRKNGLDPLGMRNSSVSLYQTFLPGISNVTLRTRYRTTQKVRGRSHGKGESTIISE
jgi:hypothetical protein